MKIKIVIYTISALMLTGCNVYSQYHRTENAMPDSYRGMAADADTATIASMPWRDMFNDSKLLPMIETALKQNQDLNVARLKVKEAEAALAAAKLAYTPSLSLNADGNVSRYDGTTTKTYNIGTAASWELDIFGRLTATKRGAFASMQENMAYQQAVQTQLVATVANTYYTLARLDAQMEINNRTLDNWLATVRTLEALKRAGMANEAGVLQAKANVMQLQSSQLSIKKSISETENAMSVMLGMPPHTIERNAIAETSLPDTISIGIPVQLLANRPDVRQAEMALMQAFYSVNVAHAAFYPNVTLSGTLGWTNNGGGVIVNPGQWLLNAIGSLTQPLFNRGANTVNLKIAQARQEEALLLFHKALLNAGKDVNDALTAYQTAKSQYETNTRLVETQREVVRKTELLMRHSTTTYLEILTAQQSLLEAETQQLQSYFDTIQSWINLYHALGGGW